MNRSTICVCLEPHDDFWGLGHLTTDRGSVFVLGWRLIPWPVDAGDDMPEAVGRVLVRAMTSLAQVTYLCSAEMKSLGDDLERLSKEKLARRLVGNWYLGNKMSFWRHFEGTHPRDLVTTESLETAMELFDSPGYCWWGQGPARLPVRVRRPTSRDRPAYIEELLEFQGQLGRAGRGPGRPDLSSRRDVSGT